MSARPHTLAAPAESRPSGPMPVSLLYTLLRHGRGLSPSEAARRAQESLGGQPRASA